MILRNFKSHIPPIIGWLILLKGVLNLVFGILTFFWNTQLSVSRDLGTLVLFWDFTPVKSLTAILMGIGYLVLGRGLGQGNRLAWQIALFWLGLNLIDSLFPRVVLFQTAYVLLLMLLLWFSRGAFDKRNKNPIRPQQAIAFFSSLFVLVYGVVGCYLLRDQYQNMHTWVDAIYYSLETYSTIGYGDILPLTQNARIFTSSMIILGVGTFLAAVSILLGPALEQRMKKVVNMVNKLNFPKNHILIMGATMLGLHTAKVLQNKGHSVVIVDEDTELLKTAENQGFKVIAGEPTSEMTLMNANIKTASALVCALTTDAQNLLGVMIAHDITKRFQLALKIISRIDEPDNIPYAVKNGATQVISPAQVFGDLVSQEISSTAAKTS